MKGTGTTPLTDFTRVYRFVAFGGPFLIRQVLRIKFSDSTRQDWLFRRGYSKDSKYETVVHDNQMVQLKPTELVGWDHGAFYKSPELELQIFGHEQNWIGGPSFLIQFKNKLEQTELRIPEPSFGDRIMLDESERIGYIGGVVICRNLPIEVAICLTLFRHFDYDGP